MSTIPPAFECHSLRAEIAQLRAEMAEKDALIASLRKEPRTRSRSPPTALFANGLNNRAWRTKHDEEDRIATERRHLLDRCVRLRRENEELRTGRNLLMHDIIKGYNEWAKTSSRIYNAACVDPERTLYESLENLVVDTRAIRRDLDIPDETDISFKQLGWPLTLFNEEPLFAFWFPPSDSEDA
jgi:hypothetical protein